MEYREKSREEYGSKFRLGVPHIVGFFMLLIAGLVFRQHVWAFTVLAALYLADIIFDFFLKFTLRPIYNAFPAGIELVTFNTVIAALVFGPMVGMFCGLLFGVTYYGIVFGFNSSYQVINIPAYGLVGFLAGILNFSNLVALGMTITVIYGLLTSFLITTIFGGKLYKSLVFIVTNVLFNYWLFSNASAIVLNIIS